MNPPCSFPCLRLGLLGVYSPDPSCLNLGRGWFGRVGAGAGTRVARRPHRASRAGVRRRSRRRRNGGRVRWQSRVRVSSWSPQKLEVPSGDGGGGERARPASLAGPRLSSAGAPPWPQHLPPPPPPPPPQPPPVALPVHQRGSPESAQGWAELLTACLRGRFSRTRHRDSFRPVVAQDSSFAARVKSRRSHLFW